MSLRYETPFVVFSSCVVVKGFKRAAIYDLQRNNYQLIPMSLFNILLDYNRRTIQEVIDIVGESEKDIIAEYFDFLLGNEFIFFTNTPELFPKLSVDFFENSLLSNCIIDFNSNEVNCWHTISSELESVGCRFLQLRNFDGIDILSLEKILSFFDDSKISYIEIILKYNNDILPDDLLILCNRYPRVFSIICHTADSTYTVDRNNNIHFVKTVISSEIICGNINHYYFNSNVKLYAESLHHNTCLNRKISIDSYGNIKNCPSMKESFGNIRDTTLKDAIEKPGFKKYWDIKKDDITVCKDCEFRHICTDCRAYVENPEDIYSKPLKCGYNPYTCEWEEWSTNPFKQKAIEYYGMQELVKNNNDKQ